MLPAVCWEGWLAPPSLLVLPPTVAIAMRFRQYLQQNMTLRAGCSARAAKRAGVTIYRVYLRQEMPCMQWHKFIFENKIYRNKLYKNYNVAAYTMKLRIFENILNLKISIEIPQHRPQIAKDTFWWQPSAHLFCYGKNAILWHAFQPQGLRHKIGPIMLKMHSKKAYQIMDLIPIPNTYQLVNLKQCLYQVHTIL